MRPRLLDLFCGAGGSAMGYHRAGFDVWGIDIEPQPNYPFEFIQADAMEVLRDRGLWHDGNGCSAVGSQADLDLGMFDAIHASPVCKAHTALRLLHPDVKHLDTLTPTRELLLETGLPWVIENVPGAPMRCDYMLCGTQFGLGTFRHRWFEVSWPVTALVAPCANHEDAPVKVWGHSGQARGSLRSWRKADWEQAMGIDWMSKDELAQAIPPAYTKWIGERLLAQLEVAA